MAVIYCIYTCIHLEIYRNVSHRLEQKHLLHHIYIGNHAYKKAGVWHRRRVHLMDKNLCANERTS